MAATMVILPVAIYLPVLLFGAPGQHPDQDHHFRLIGTQVEALRRFDLAPSLSPEGNNGYGSYDVRVYPPFFHIVSAAAIIVTGSWQAGLFASFAFFGVLGMLGIFFFSREFGTSQPGSLFAAIAFGVTPYWLNHAYNSFFYGEIAAIGVMPWCFLLACRVCRSTTFPRVAGLSISFAALALSNLPQLVIVSIGLTIFVIFQLEKPRLLRQISALLVSFCLALVLSGFYLVRVIVESPWFKISLPNTDPAYDPRNNFAFGFLTSPNSVDNGWFAGVLLALCIGSLSIAFIASGKIREVLGTSNDRAMLAILLFATVIMLPVSEPFWSFGPLQKIQFPWRFLSIAAIGSSLLLARCFDRARSASTSSRRPRLIVFVGVILALATFGLKQLILAAEYHSPEQLQARLTRLERSVGLEHWQPVWVDHTVFASPSESSIVVHQTDKPGQVTIETGPETAPILVLPLAFYPYWKANLSDGISASGKGALTLHNAPRNSRLELTFVEPAVNIVAGYLSLITILSLLGVFLAMLLRSAGSYKLKWTK